MEDGLELSEGIAVSHDVVHHYTTHPAFESRRVRINSHHLIEMIATQLIGSGVAGEDLHGARWLWTTGEVGPDLVLILSGGLKS